MSAPMTDRIYEADLTEIGFAYCSFADLPWLSWPIQTTEMGDAEWVAWIVKTVARAPVCGRTAEVALAELSRIANPRLQRIIPRVRELVAA